MRRRLLCAMLVVPALFAPRPALPFADEAAKGPRISIAPDHFDFGAVLAEKEVSREFVIRNVGSADLSIEKVSTSCGCTVADGYSPVVKPGGSTVLRVKVTTPRSVGRLQKSVLVRSNDPVHPTVELKVEATVGAPAQ